MVPSLDNLERLQFTARCFGQPHDGYGKQVDMIARSALAMVNASLHFLHMWIIRHCIALSFILWASEFDATNGTLFGGFLRIPFRIQPMVGVTSHVRTPILHLHQPTNIDKQTNTYILPRGGYRNREHQYSLAISRSLLRGTVAHLRCL
jgi:hypothetical protein